MSGPIESSVVWAARVRAEQAARTPAEVEADRLWMEDWLASLPRGLPVPLQPGQTIVIFNPRKKGGSMPKGQGLVEYALILVMVAVVVIVILALLGPAVGNLFSGVILYL